MKKERDICVVMQLLTLIFFFHFFAPPLWGLDPDQTVDQYLVDQWKMTDGLPSNTILTIAQTPDGYLWFATTKGLLKFDGLTFSTVHFTGKKETPLPDTLHVDKEGTLWIGSVHGLTSYRHQSRRFKTYTTADGLTADRIRHIAEDINGNLWISFYSSYVTRFSEGTFTAFNRSHGLNCNKVNTLAQIPTGNLLFGTSETGVYRFKGERFHPYPLPGLENLRVNTMAEDHRGVLWIGTTNGLFSVNGEHTVRYSVRDGLSFDYVSIIREDSERRLWIGTIKGLNRLIRKPDGAMAFESRLKDISILTLFEDRERSLWAGTPNTGIYRLKNGKFFSFAPHEPYPQEMLLSLLKDRRGDTWIGTIQGELLRFRDQRLIETAAPRELSGTGISAIEEDAAGDLWLGTLGKGVYHKKNDTLTRFTTDNGLNDNQVTSLYRDSRNDLWFSTFDGVTVYRWADRHWESLHAGNGLSGKRAHNVFEDNAHNIWVAADKGITVLKSGKLTKESINYYLDGVSVTCIYQDDSVLEENGAIFWIATHGEGLKRLPLKDGKVATFKTEHGLTTNVLFRFYEDQRENFWIMSDSGILRVGKSELNRLARGEHRFINCTSFGTAEGMKNSEFSNPFSRRSSLQTADGALWFVTREGISIVRPDTLKMNRVAPKVAIEKMTLDRRTISLPPAKSTFRSAGEFRFFFTAPTFLSPGKIRFKYRLEGLDDDWAYLSPDQERTARYANLPGGTYTFRVTACNAEGVWNRQGAGVTFTVKQVFYRTGFFWLMVAVSLAALAVVSGFLNKRHRARQKAAAGSETAYNTGMKDGEKKEKYKGSTLNPVFAKARIKELRRLLDVEKVYRDETISLDALADRLSIPAYQLSQLLNDNLQRNFFDTINYHRIEEVKKILLDPAKSQEKIATVAYGVGFNSMTAFYKAFKKFTGMTPRQFKKASEHAALE